MTIIGVNIRWQGNTTIPNIHQSLFQQNLHYNQCLRNFDKSSITSSAQQSIVAVRSPASDYNDDHNIQDFAQERHRLTSWRRRTSFLVSQICRRKKLAHQDYRIRQLRGHRLEHKAPPSISRSANQIEGWRTTDRKTDQVVVEIEEE